MRPVLKTTCIQRPLPCEDLLVGAQKLPLLLILTSVQRPPLYKDRLVGSQKLLILTSIQRPPPYKDSLFWSLYTGTVLKDQPYPLPPSLPPSLLQYSFEDLLCLIQASEDELYKALDKLQACPVRGKSFTSTLSVLHHTCTPYLSLPHPCSILALA